MPCSSTHGGSWLESQATAALGAATAAHPNAVATALSVHSGTESGGLHAPASMVTVAAHPGSYQVITEDTVTEMLRVIFKAPNRPVGPACLFWCVIRRKSALHNTVCSVFTNEIGSPVAFNFDSVEGRLGMSCLPATDDVAFPLHPDVFLDPEGQGPSLSTLADAFKAEQAHVAKKGNDEWPSRALSARSFHPLEMGFALKGPCAAFHEAMRRALWETVDIWCKHEGWTPSRIDEAPLVFHCTLQYHVPEDLSLSDDAASDYPFGFWIYVCSASGSWNNKALNGLLLNLVLCELATQPDEAFALDGVHVRGHRACSCA